MRLSLRWAAVAVVAVLCLRPPARAASAVLEAAAAPGFTRVQFQAVVANQLREYMSLSPAAGLTRLQALTALPSAQFPALAVDVAAAQAALSLIASPNVAALRDDRETRIPLTRFLGRENVAAIVTASEGLGRLAAADPALAASLTRLRTRFQPKDAFDRSDIVGVATDLKRLFDRAAVPGFTSVSLGDAVDAGSILIPVHRSGLTKPAGKAAAALAAAPASEDAGFVVSEQGADGRARRYKIYPQDALTFERRAIPQALSEIYEELPGGAVRQRQIDPLMGALNAAKIDLWTVRHGETETNRARLLAGSGIDSGLTKTAGGQGHSGQAQARAAAVKMYQDLGGDAWARAVLAGIQKPVVILASPLKRARQTASAFTELLDHQRRRLAGPSARLLYEAHIDRGLAELSFGDLEGWTLDKARTLGAWPAFDGITGPGRNFLDRFPKGESRFDVLLRQRGVLRRMIKDYRGRQVVTFAHFETVAAQKAVLGLLTVDPADGALKVGAIPNAEPVRLSFGPAR